jgi:hypothetical protein
MNIRPNTIQLSWIFPGSPHEYCSSHVRIFTLLWSGAILFRGERLGMCSSISAKYSCQYSQASSTLGTLLIHNALAHASWCTAPTTETHALGLSWLTAGSPVHVAASDRLMMTNLTAVAFVLRSCKHPLCSISVISCISNKFQNLGCFELKGSGKAWKGSEYVVCVRSFDHLCITFYMMISRVFPVGVPCVCHCKLGMKCRA